MAAQAHYPIHQYLTVRAENAMLILTNDAGCTHKKKRKWRLIGFLPPKTAYPHSSVHMNIGQMHISIAGERKGIMEAGRPHEMKCALSRWQGCFLG